METKEQRIRRKFRKVINKSPEFLNLDRKKALDLMCDWFKENHRQIKSDEFDLILAKCKKE
jgi:hypothetical protein|tara:strand:- start:79 stop:261 length:183 start_codon:yes stop_codon:yes gene_type:complete